MLWSDLKFAVRGLIAAPGLSAAAIVALALGIGPNTAIFSLVYATLFAPLPYSNPDQLVRVSPMVGEVQDRVSPAEYLKWKKRATSFQYLEAFRPGRTLNLAARDAPEIVVARQVTPGGHRMLSERVWLGRDFRPDEDQPGKQHVVILTHRLWRERFGADRDIIGRDVRMDAIPYQQLLEKFQAVPGVAKASVSTGLPLLGLESPASSAWSDSPRTSARPGQAWGSRW